MPLLASAPTVTSGWSPRLPLAGDCQCRRRWVESDPGQRPFGWNAAGAWATHLLYCGFNDWRLPTLNPQDTTHSNSIDNGGGFGLQNFGTGCAGEVS